jgi:phospholipid/cholesterol/gamma-HCH transport system ATP-binding protein
MRQKNLSVASDGTLLRFADVAFSYEERQILNRVSFSVRSGQVVALMGGSGSGKTTILKLLAGLISSSRGTIEVGGVNYQNIARSQLYELRSRFGFMFQHGALFTDLSVFENVAFPLREHTKIPEFMIKDLVLMKLQAVGLRAVHHLMPSSLSGGMARRVALARTIALDPSLILYDEPFTGLDPVSLGMTARLIRRLNDALGATSIVVSHDVQETFSIADYVYFLSKGEIIAAGTPDELMKTPHPYVRQFIDGAEEGPVPFHISADKTYYEDMGLKNG